MTEAANVTRNLAVAETSVPETSGSSSAVSGNRSGVLHRWPGRRVFIGLAICILAIFSRNSWWPPVFHHMALRSLSAQQPQKALRWLDRAEWMGAQRVDTALLRCRASRRIGDPDQIQAAIAEAVARGAEPRLIEREQLLFQAQSGEMSRAGPYLSQLLTDTSGDNLDVCASFVIGYLRNQRYREAGTLVDALMKDAPEDPFPWYVRGRVSALQQLLPKAEADYREAIRRSPQWMDPIISLAELLAETHRQREAIDLFKQVLPEPALAGRAAVGLAECLKATGNPQKAREVLLQTLPLAENDPSLLISLGRIEFEESRFSEAASVLSKALTARPWADDAFFILAQCQRQMGLEKEATKTFEKVEEFRKALAELRQLEDQISANPTDEAIRLRSGELMLKYRDPQDGVVELQSVLDLNPGCREAHALLADYFSRGEPMTDSARKQMEYHRQRSR